jgi:transaldolase
MDPPNRWTLPHTATCHRQCALAKAVLIPFHANRIQHVQISKYLLFRNYMGVKSLRQFFYYLSKYLNSMKCQKISLGPSKCTIQYSFQKLCKVYDQFSTTLSNLAYV